MVSVHVTETHHIFRRILRCDHGPILTPNGGVLERVGQFVTCSLQARGNAGLFGSVILQDDGVSFSNGADSMASKSGNGQQTRVHCALESLFLRLAQQVRHCQTTLGIRVDHAHALAGAGQEDFVGDVSVTARAVAHHRHSAHEFDAGRLGDG